MTGGTSAHGGKAGFMGAANNMGDAQLLERFVHAGDEKAFEALVRRHGPMVLGVCQRILHNLPDAEDAFQATFLVLVRKAPTLTKPELLGNWLYGVAYRTALKARSRAFRRASHERQAVIMAAGKSFTEALALQEMRDLLDEELEQLPTKYRAALVLCYLEGMTNLEAARLLGWPTGSMSHRLARGRELLRKRLSQRNSALPSLAFGLLLERSASPVAVSGRVVEATVQTAMHVGGGQALLAGKISAARTTMPEAHLNGMSPGRRAKGSLPKPRSKRMPLGRQKVTTAVLVAVVLAALAAGGLVFAHALGPPAFKPTQGMATSAAKDREPEAAKSRQTREEKAQPGLLERIGQSSPPCH